MILRYIWSGVLALLLFASPSLASDRKPVVISPTSGQQQQIQTGDAVGAAYGGTGLNTLTSHCVLVGQGTSAAHLVCPSSAGQVLTDNGATSDPSFAAASSGCTMANPTATASDTAVNGTATTCMRSDAAPAVQKGSSSAFGVVKVDGTTITASAGVISASGGGGSGACTNIASATPSGTATVSFTSIPGTYKYLLIVGQGRSTVSGTGTDTVAVRFNSDAGSNYYWQSVFAIGSTAGAGPGTTPYIRGAEIETAGDAANQAASFDIKIPNYNGTTFYKRALYEYGVNNTATTNNLVYQAGTGSWYNTAAITRIDLVLTSGSGNWLAGSQISLDGCT